MKNKNESLQQGIRRVLTEWTAIEIEQKQRIRFLEVDMRRTLEMPGSSFTFSDIEEGFRQAGVPFYLIARPTTERPSIKTTLRGQECAFYVKLLRYEIDARNELEKMGVTKEQNLENLRNAGFPLSET